MRDLPTLAGPMRTSLIFMLSIAPRTVLGGGEKQRGLERWGLAGSRARRWRGSWGTLFWDTAVSYYFYSV
eukprot:scaffold63422_cov24-Tisochrysis_lutea.AAC.1